MGAHGAPTNRLMKTAFEQRVRSSLRWTIAHGVGHQTSYSTSLGASYTSQIPRNPSRKYQHQKKRAALPLKRYARMITGCAEECRPLPCETQEKGESLGSELD